MVTSPILEEAKEVKSSEEESSYENSEEAVSGAIAVKTELKQHPKQNQNVAKYHDWDQFVEKEPQKPAVGDGTLTKTKKLNATIIPPPTYADQRNVNRVASQMV